MTHQELPAVLRLQGGIREDASHGRAVRDLSRL
jgi:hypothetical protein